MNIVTDKELKFKALQSSVYCPPYEEEPAIFVIKITPPFDVEIIKDKIRKSVELIGHQDHYKPLILEILDILDLNKNAFLIDEHKYITFYWSGILVCKIEIDIEAKHNKQLHVSLQKYIKEIEIRENERQSNKLIMYGFGGSAVIASSMILFSLWNRS